MGRDDDWEDDDDDRPRRRRSSRDRDQDDEDDDYDRRSRRKSGAKSGAVTGVGIISIILGSLVLLLGLCMLIGVFAMGDAGGRGGGFAIPGFGNAMAIVIIVMLVILLWGALAITSGAGVLNRRQWARILVLIISGIGAAFGILCLIGAFGVLGATAQIQGAAGAGFMGFLIYFLIAAVFIGYCIWAYVVLLNSRNGAEFS